MARLRRVFYIPQLDCLIRAASGEEITVGMKG